MDDELAAEPWDTPEQELEAQAADEVCTCLNQTKKQIKLYQHVTAIIASTARACCLQFPQLIHTLGRPTFHPQVLVHEVRHTLSLKQPQCVHVTGNLGQMLLH